MTRKLTLADFGAQMSVEKEMKRQIAADNVARLQALASAGDLVLLDLSDGIVIDISILDEILELAERQCEVSA